MSTCQDLQPLLSDFVDGQLAGDERAAVIAHLETCAACRGLVADLEHLRATARQLRPIPPPDHVWLEVAGQIRLDAPASPAVSPAAVARPTRRAAAQWLGLAAALVLVTLGVYLVDALRTPPSGPAAPPAAAASGGSIDTVAKELSLAFEHYDKAIAELQLIAQSNEGALDPVVASTLQKNLAVVDRAIADSRAALAADPENEPARESLLDSLRRKIGVLQTTVALMNEMRKGDATGAARVAGGRS